MRHLRWRFSLLLGIFLSTGSYAQSYSGTKFLQEAATIGMNAEALGKLGQKRLENQKTKAYALELLNKQVVANAQLKTLAKKKKIKLPEPMSIPINSMQTRTDSAATDTAALHFDSEYLDMVIADQKKAITLFEDGAKLSDKDIKSYASRYLSVYKKNLEAALKLSQDTIKKD